MPDSQVVTVMRQYKAALLRGERSQMQEMARRWLAVERRLTGQMEALAWEMDAIKRSGATVTRELLMTQQRYRELTVQLTQELERYSDNEAVQITAQQRRLARLGVAHAENAIQASGVRAGFNRLPTEAVEYMVGLGGNGSPLRQLLANSWPLSVDGLTQELINGVALGYNPRKTARMMAQGMTGSLDRMMVIARTEQLRVYRQANRESYIASGVVDSYKRLATHDSRVCAACLMDEGHTYELGEEMPEHPQGRCTMVPVVGGIPTPKWKQGREWFEEQSPETQKDILGKGRYYAWQNGDFDLGDLVKVTPNATWGPSIGVTPLGKLGGVGQVVNAVPVVPVRSTAPTFATHGEAKQWALANIMREGAILSDVNIDSLELGLVDRVLARIAQRFDEGLVGRHKYTAISFNPERRVLMSTNGDILTLTKSHSTVASYTEALRTNIEHMRLHGRPYVTIGHFTEQDMIESVVDHEIGHIVSKRARPELIRQWEDWFAGNKSRITYSSYAQVSGDEAFSEAFALYTNGKRDLIPDDAVGLVESIIESSRRGENRFAQ